MPPFEIAAFEPADAPTARDDDGVEVRAGAAVLRVTALTDHVLRVTAGRDGLPPENGSWAVLPAARAARAAVTPAPDGFATSALRVRLERDPFRLVVEDRGGREVLADVPGRALRFDGEEFTVAKSLAPGMAVFGLGDKAGPLNRRGQSFVLWNTDAYGYQESTDPLYKAVPFFMLVQPDGAACGVLLDNSFRSAFDFGRRAIGRLEFGADGGPIDYYVLHGPEPKAVLERYAWLTGTPPLPPRWALGFQQSRWSYADEATVRAIAARLRAERIPCDAVYLDIGYQDRNRPFTVDRARFPAFEGLIGDLAAQDLRVVAITDLHIADARGEGYAPFDSGEAGDHFVRRADGSPFTGEVWPGACRFPDFTRAATREWWGGLYARFADAGIAGFWNDMNEPAMFGDSEPMDMVHRIEQPGFATRTAAHGEIHNVYGSENARATHEGLLRLRPDVRPFVLTRASFAGGQRWAATWTGDNSSSWNHLKLSTAQLLNLGLSGFSMAGEDVGGFAGDAGPELLTRWHQIGAFRPLFRNHAAKCTADQEPWVGGAPHVSLRRRAIETRYRLLPYLYTLAEEASRTGVPMLRPVFLEFPQAVGSLLDHEGWFMLGPHLLVAPPPILESPHPQTLIPPPGGWYDYWSGAPIVLEDAVRPFQGGTRPVRCLTVETSLDRLPVLVRAGAILPHQPLTQSTAERPPGPLELHVYPDADRRAEGALYWDDGESFAFRRGDWLRQRFTWDGVLRVESEGDHRPWWDEVAVVVHG